MRPSVNFADKIDRLLHPIYYASRAAFDRGLKAGLEIGEDKGKHRGFEDAGAVSMLRCMGMAEVPGPAAC